MESRCEYIEQAVMDSQQGMAHQLGDFGGQELFTVENQHSKMLHLLWNDLSN
jgi:hypothetical protein